MGPLRTAYAVAVHAMLGVALLAALRPAPRADPSRRQADFLGRMVGYHERQSSQGLSGFTVFLGDSITQGLSTDSVAMPSANFGVGSDTTVGLLSRIPRYRLADAKGVVVAIGLNDLRERPEAETLANFRSILAAIPPGVPVVWSAVLPVDEAAAGRGFAGYNRRIAALNAAAGALCASRPRCRFADAGPDLAGPGMRDDGIHLTPAGYRAWSGVLRRALDW